MLFEKACVHTYSQGGQNLVVDGNSGAVHVLDTEAMSLIREACARDDIQNLEDLDEFLKSKAHSSDIVEEISALVECGLLFSPDLTEAPPRPETIVKALCLNVAHDCNLRCDYCFASTGDFKGARELMSLDVAKAAVDFLLQNSKHRKQLEIDFFGGEPLMNWDVVRQTVEYAEVEAAKLDKTFRFTITTNGLGLTPAIEEFINEHMYNVVLSIDGRKEVNDRVRRTVSNKGSVYEVIIPKFQRLVQNRGDQSYYVRGTFTAHNLDFSRDVAHLHDLGFDQISMEPVVADAREDYALGQEHLPRILEEYDRLAELYLERRRRGQGFNFFHFNVDLQKGPCLYKRISGCGAGYEYLAVAPSGELFPCHQFVGEPEYVLGTVWTGIEKGEISRAFKDSHVLSKPICRSCWAKYYCSGGCEKHTLDFSGNRLLPDDMACAMEKKRLECSFYIQAVTTEDDD